MMKVIRYFRVSTAQQAHSGLGLEAQQMAVESYCRGRDCETLATYREVESGKRNDRPELLKALHHAKVTGATLLIAKLDRLSRNVAFLATLQDSGTRFVAADMPEANELTIHIMAAVAQAERKAISRRTIEALAAAKAGGKRLGNPNGAAALKRAGKGTGAALQAIRADADRHAEDLRPIIVELREQGVTSLPRLASALNQRRMETPRGGRWHPSSVRNLLRRLSSLEAEK